jgi:hypothetical protein
MMMKKLTEQTLTYMKNYPTRYVFPAAFNDLNNYESKEKMYKDLNAQVTPKEIDEYFSGMGLEFDLITTITPFHDKDIVNNFEDAIYNDRELYKTPMYKIQDSLFLAKHIKNNYM